MKKCFALDEDVSHSEHVYDIAFDTNLMCSGLIICMCGIRHTRVRRHINTICHRVPSSSSASSSSSSTLYSVSVFSYFVVRFCAFRFFFSLLWSVCDIRHEIMAYHAEEYMESIVGLCCLSSQPSSVQLFTLRHKREIAHQTANVFLLHWNRSDRIEYGNFLFLFCIDNDNAIDIAILASLSVFTENFNVAAAVAIAVGSKQQHIRFMEKNVGTCKIEINLFLNLFYV